MRKRYLDEACPAQIEVAKLLYGIYGVDAATSRVKPCHRRNDRFRRPRFSVVTEDMLPWSAMDAGLMLQTPSLKPLWSRGADSCPVGILATHAPSLTRSSRSPEGCVQYRFAARLRGSRRFPINARCTAPGYPALEGSDAMSDRLASVPQPLRRDIVFD